MRNQFVEKFFEIWRESGVKERAKHLELRQVVKNNHDKDQDEASSTQDDVPEPKIRLMSRFIQ